MGAVQMRRLFSLNRSLLFLLGGLTCAQSGLANECARVTEDALRLDCYDKRFPRQFAPETSAPVESAEAVARPTAESSAPKPESEPGLKLARSKMVDDWDLAPGKARESFQIRPYKPTYLLLGTRTDNINRQPESDNPQNSASSPLNLRGTEAQFQLSFKTKVADKLFGDNGSLWIGYTQSSRWQVYTSALSRPFRETNYEPEAMLVFRTPLSVGDWNLRMSGIGINHQSNGRSNPLSRSWNRVIAHFGIERGDLSIQIRPWWRLPEDDIDDNNPHIENYVGRGELIVVKRLDGHVISVQGRHSLRGQQDSRGSLRVDWAIPVSGNLKAHLSAFSGYGESMIDYNHRQTMFGLGVSLIDW